MSFSQQRHEDMAARGGLDQIRVVLLGKTGAGKSSTGNSLLGRDPFRVARGLRSGTERCQWADAEIESEGILLMVTDTPGLCDTHREEGEVLKEVGKSIAVASPGPHVILMVLRGDVRFTEEEFLAYNTLKTMFGPEVKDYMIAVFVGLDSYGDTMEEQTEQFNEGMRSADGNLKTVLDDANRRIFAINNKAPPHVRQRQAGQLIKMIKDLKRQHGGSYFQNAMSDQVNKLVSPLVTDRMAQGNMTQSEAVRQTNRAIVEETESSDFFDKLLDFMSHKVLPKIKKGLAIAKDVAQIARHSRALYAECIVM